MWNPVPEIRSLNGALPRKSWTNYLEVLGRLARAHEGTASNLITEVLGDQDRMLDAADFLSQQSYATPYEHLMANQFAYLIKKYPFNTGNKPEAKAREMFHEAEQRCKAMNERYPEGLFTGPILAKAQQWIWSLLGPSPQLSLIYQRCGFSAGASIGVHGDATSLNRKIGSEELSVTPSALCYATAALRNDPHFVERFTYFNEKVENVMQTELFGERLRKVCSVVRHNKIAFVPKTARTHRTIAVEPLLNGYLQKGVDLHMRDILRRVGLDLTDQSRNQIFARFGSEDWEDPDGFCTIDLKSASDSISIAVAKWALPPKWFDFLNSIRSKHYRISNGSEERYEKFCSMGNGFCFPLETLIFASVCHAVTGGYPRRDFTVYGDDIIVRKTQARDVIESLSILGFKTNSDKTFLSGPFRESCGSDWFGGVDVRPFVLDFRLDSLESLFKFLNLTRRSPLVEEFFEPIRDFVISMIPKRLRFFRPYNGPEDTAITVEIDKFMASPFARWDRNFQRWDWTELLSLPVTDSFGLRGTWSTSIMMSALVRGFPSHNTFTFRRKTRTTVRRVLPRQRNNAQKGPSWPASESGSPTQL